MKYLVKNDISYLFNKKKSILILILLAPLISLFLKINNQTSILSIILSSTGTNLTLENIDIVSVLMYLFNIFCFIYLIIIIYTKDLDDYLDNIFF